MHFRFDVKKSFNFTRTKVVNLKFFYFKKGVFKHHLAIRFRLYFYILLYINICMIFTCIKNQQLSLLFRLIWTFMFHEYYNLADKQ